MKKNILLTIAYDGTNYFGWQKQKDMNLPTIQGEMEKACSRLFKQEIECIGASRTDRGVHALGQRASITINSTIPTEKIPLAVHSYLSKDIVVIKAQEVSEDFHPRFDCVKKTYEYKIYNEVIQNPLFRNYSEFIHKKLDILTMQEAATQFIGTYDFKAFCAAGSSVKTTIRTIFDCNVKKENEFIIIQVTGDGFLYNMVRILSGTLIYAGLGKIKPNEIVPIIQSKDRTKAGKTAGAQGLLLKNIEYEMIENCLKV